MYPKTKTILRSMFIVGTLFILSGCFGGSDSGAGGVFKSTDSGKTFSPAVQVDEKRSIASVSVLSMAVDPSNPEHLYIGTRESGLFETRDGAAQWTPLNFPLDKIYGIVVNPRNTQEVFATGVFEGRAKLFRSRTAGQEWEEVYIEPRTGTVITALAMDPRDPQRIYIGTTEGALLRSTTAGETWAQLHTAPDAITAIGFDSSDAPTLYVQAHDRALLRSRDDGTTFEDITKKVSTERSRSIDFTALTVHPSQSGRLYVGTDKGIFVSNDFGDVWQEVRTISQLSNTPVRAIAVNPFNADRITYAAAQAVYTATSDTEWIVTDIAPGHIVDELRYDPFDPQVIYAGVRGAN